MRVRVLCRCDKYDGPQYIAPPTHTLISHPPPGAPSRSVVRPPMDAADSTMAAFDPSVAEGGSSIIPSPQGQGWRSRPQNISCDGRIGECCRTISGQPRQHPILCHPSPWSHWCRRSNTCSGRPASRPGCKLFFHNRTKTTCSLGCRAPRSSGEIQTFRSFSVCVLEMSIR